MVLESISENKMFKKKIRALRKVIKFMFIVGCNFGMFRKHLHYIRKMISALKLELDREILHKWIDRLSLEKEWGKIEIQREIDMD